MNHLRILILGAFVISIWQPSLAHLSYSDLQANLTTAADSEDPDLTIAFIETPSSPASSSSRQAVTNGAQTYRAYTLSKKGAPQQVFIENIQTHKVFLIQGLPPSPREFSQLVWLGESILSLDRWSSPHFGYRYEIDVNQKKLLRVVSLSG